MGAAPGNSRVIMAAGAMPEVAVTRPRYADRGGLRCRGADRRDATPVHRYRMSLGICDGGANIGDEHRVRHIRFPDHCFPTARDRCCVSGTLRTLLDAAEDGDAAKTGDTTNTEEGSDAAAKNWRDSAGYLDHRDLGGRRGHRLSGHLCDSRIRDLTRHAAAALTEEGQTT